MTTINKVDILAKQLAIAAVVFATLCVGAALREALLKPEVAPCQIWQSERLFKEGSPVWVESVREGFVLYLTPDHIGRWGYETAPIDEFLNNHKIILE